jgi:TPR repeat protein
MKSKKSGNKSGGQDEEMQELSNITTTPVPNWNDSLAELDRTAQDFNKKRKLEIAQSQRLEGEEIEGITTELVIDTNGNEYIRKTIRSSNDVVLENVVKIITAFLNTPNVGIAQLVCFWYKCENAATSANDYTFELYFEKANGTLEDFVKEFPDYFSNSNNFLQFIGSLLAVCEHLAQQNIIHGDIRPQNILYHKDSDEETARFKIAYVGFHKLVEGDATIPGSINYKAPEIIAGANRKAKGFSEQKNDVFSLGVVLLQIRGNEPSNQNFNSRADGKLYSKLATAIAKTATFDNKKDLNIENVLKKMLSIDPDSRSDFSKLKSMLHSKDLKMSEVVKKEKMEYLEEEDEEYGGTRKPSRKTAPPSKLSKNKIFFGILLLILIFAFFFYLYSSNQYTEANTDKFRILQQKIPQTNNAPTTNTANTGSDRPESVSILYSQAEKGDPQAQYILGMMYLSGQVVQKSEVEATFWLKKSSDKGWPDAFEQLAIMYPDGLDDEENFTENEEGDDEEVRSFEYYLEAAQNGNATAQYQVALSYLLKGEIDKVFDWMSKAAEQNHGGAMHALGLMYVSGEGVPADTKIGGAWLFKAADSGVADALLDVADLLSNPLNDAKRNEDSFKRLDALAFNGNASAQYEKAIMLLEGGSGIEKNDREAARLLREAAKKGHAEAPFVLGSIYQNGVGVKKSFATAVGWYRKAAKRGHAEAQYRVGTMYLGGFGTPVNFTKSYTWMRKAANNGILDAQIKLAYLIGCGKGTTKDMTKAYNWLIKAADRSDPRAESTIGWLYLHGEGVEQDYQEAMKWFQRAADQDFFEGEFNIGIMYATGQGVEKNIATAVEWFSKAAVHGDLPARRALRRGLGLWSFKDNGHSLFAKCDL